VQPSVNNQSGRIDLQGGIPGGINVSSGLVTTLTFRVKSVGNAVIKFLDNSKALLHDGKGTNDLNDTTNGVYTLVLPPPAGPIVSSETHPDQNLWYKSPNAVLTWSDENQGAERYSYELSNEPTSIPDDIVDSKNTSATYRNLSGGIKYFHIKALRGGVWGGTTHFALKIDSVEPADFEPQVVPSKRTVRKQPIIQFSTTDAESGIDHYELKLIPLSPDNIKTNSQSSQPLFIEVTSPYIPSPLDLGKYDVIVRAYDQAGNFREKTITLNIVSTAFEFVSGEGVQLASNVIVPWLWFLPPMLLFILVLIYLAYRLRKWHREVEKRRAEKILPEVVINQLDELTKYRQKYGKMLVMLLFLLPAVFYSNFANAAEPILSPPLISVVSRNISNEDIFYLGGKTDTATTDVVIHVQSLQSGETLSYEVTSDKNGDWFYRHDTFLNGGEYMLWAQSKIGQQLSAPSPQERIYVKATALQFGGSRISYELLYLILVLNLLLVIIILGIYIYRHSKHARRKHKLLLEEIRSAEESVKRGFAVIKRDLEAELLVIKKAKLKGELSYEESQREQQLLSDIEDIEAKLGKEIWELENLENT
jgi:preprotein translocase subunit YajC